MNNIEIGEYVRSTRGELIKIENEIMQGNYMCYFKNSYCNIKSHSKNIIDLIEVGDYVNGEQIDFISTSKEGNKRLTIRDNTYFFDKYNSIKSIVTKEQFKEKEYRV